MYFSVGARRCVPDNDCLPDPMCITPMILQDDTSDDDVREGVYISRPLG